MPRLQQFFQPHAELCHESIKTHQRRDLASRHCQRASNLCSSCFRAAKKKQSRAHTMGFQVRYSQRHPQRHLRTTTPLFLLYHYRVRLTLPHSVKYAYACASFRFFYPNPPPACSHLSYSPPSRIIGSLLIASPTYMPLNQHKTNPAN